MVAKVSLAEEQNVLPDIDDIANWFLLKGKMTNKRIQKLCYYAQAWSLVFLDAPIADNARFEAWVHGPVNTVLWKRFKEYNWQEFDLVNVEATEKQVKKRIDSERVKVLDTVWEAYGEYDGNQLETLSHTEKPWLEKRKGLGKFEGTTRKISEKTMKTYYQSMNG